MLDAAGSGQRGGWSCGHPVCDGSSSGCAGSIGSAVYGSGVYGSGEYAGVPSVGEVVVLAAGPDAYPAVLDPGAPELRTARDDGHRPGTPLSGPVRR